MQNDETRILADFRRRDRQAFDTLYRRYAANLLAFALRITGGCRADAEDLVQETFVAAYRGATEFRGGARLLTYLTGILLRRHRDNNRRKAPMATSLFEDTDRNYASSHADVADLFASRIESQTIAQISFDRALALLDEPMRTAFLLVAAQGMTHKEAAALLQTPVGTVKWRVAEATRRMRATLTEMENEDDLLPQKLRP